MSEHVTLVQCLRIKGEFLARLHGDEPIYDEGKLTRSLLDRAAATIEALQAQIDAQPPADLLAIARGCQTYHGGYHDDETLAVYHHGISTVITALEAATREGGPWDFQVEALRRCGADTAKPPASVDTEHVRQILSQADMPGWQRLDQRDFDDLCFMYEHSVPIPIVADMESKARRCVPVLSRLYQRVAKLAADLANALDASRAECNTLAATIAKVNTALCEAGVEAGVEHHEGVRRIVAECERPREVLRDVEWAGCDSVWHESCCPWCEGHRPDCTCDGCSAYTYAHRHKGHCADCAIDATQAGP